MANLAESSIWETGVYQIEENDPVHGGANGITNRPIKQLANRTVWLKNELASSVQAINANLANLSTNKADKTLNLVAGNGLTGGGTLQANRTLTLGTPSQITASSTNAVSATSHTHAIDKASTTVAGVVQLVDNLTTDDATKALTAKQGKALHDNKLDKTANAVSASKLATARTINGVAFDGTANITITDNTKAPTVHRHNWNEIDLVPAVISNPEQITQGDLDSYMTEGFYYCNDNTQATNIANTPVNRAFALQVLKTAGVVQVCYEYQTTNVFVRARSGSSSWSAWRRLSTTEDNAPTATRLQTPRNIAMTGDGSWNVNFDGSANASGTLTLANSGVTAGSYNSVTVDAKGRVTRGLSQVHGLITATTATGTANQATTNANTYLNIVASGVGSTASVGSSTQVTGTDGISVSSDTSGKLIISRDSNSPTATKLQTARTINGVPFDGTANITITDNTKAPAVHRHNWSEIDGKPSTFTPSSHTHSISNITDFDVREITSESLDDITKWGIYAQMANSNATAERKYPVPAEAGTLEVIISTYGLRQRFTTFNTHRHFERRRNNPMTGWENWVEVSNTWDAIRGKPSNLAYTSSNVASATRLQTARTISLTGAVTGSVSFNGSANVSIATSDDNSIGLIAYFAANSAPTGWLKANGAAVSRTTYAKLFAKIGTTFGAGDGSTTFNLPDLRGEFIRGFDDGRNVDGGRQFGSSQSDATPDHYHGIGFGDRGNDVFIKRGDWAATTHETFFACFGEGGGRIANALYSNIDKNSSLATSGVNGINGENRPRNIALLACIKF